MSDQKRPTYRIINCNLVRLPNDERRPNRLYRSVGSQDGGCDVELTENEERQKNEDGELWLSK